MCKPYSCASFYMDNIDSCAIKLTQLRELRAIHCDICAIKAKIGAIITKMCVIQVDSPINPSAILKSRMRVLLPNRGEMLLSAPNLTVHCLP